MNSFVSSVVCIVVSGLALSLNAGHAEDSVRTFDLKQIAQTCITEIKEPETKKGVKNSEEEKQKNCPLKHFFKENEGIFRGQRPTTDLDFDLLKSLGVKVIVNIEDYFSASHKDIQEETRKAALRGIEVVHQPLSPIFLNKKDDVRKILSVMANSEKKPVYLHCKYGRERTGLLVALHQIFNLGVPVSDAKQAMQKRGFRAALVPVMTLQLKYWLHRFVALGEIPPSN